MTAFDYAVLVTLLLSALLGVWRGLISEVLSLGGWLVAGWLARQFGEDLAPLLSTWLAPGPLQLIAATVLVFVLVLVVLAVVRFMLRELLHAAGLGGVDRILGGMFGLLRGVLIALVVVLLAGFTRIPREAWWQDAVLSRPLELGVLMVRDWLPEAMAERIRYR